jgi:hypothetical protein
MLGRAQCPVVEIVDTTARQAHRHGFNAVFCDQWRAHHKRKQRYIWPGLGSASGRHRRRSASRRHHRAAGRGFVAPLAAGRRGSRRIRRGRRAAGPARRGASPTPGGGAALRLHQCAVLLRRHGGHQRNVDIHEHRLVGLRRFRAGRHQPVLSGGAAVSGRPPEAPRPVNTSRHPGHAGGGAGAAAVVVRPEHHGAVAGGQSRKLFGLSHRDQLALAIAGVRRSGRRCGHAVAIPTALHGHADCRCCWASPPARSRSG